MENKKNNFKWGVAGSVIALSVMLWACNKAEDPLDGQVTQVINNESTQEAQLDEVDDISLTALGNTDSPAGNGRVGGAPFFFNDYRLACAIVTRDTSDFKTKGSGKITIDFGTGCEDKFGNVRAGKMIISWTGGRWFNPGSEYIITFSGYSINNVKFSDNDIRTIDNVSTPDLPLTFNVVASHTLTWLLDNSTATRVVHKTKEWIRSDNIVDDKFIVSQTTTSIPAAMGINRHGVAYSMAITVPLEYDRSCAIANKVFKPVKGVKVITYDTNKVVTIDFGDGTCDKTFTVSVNGKTRTFNGRNDGSGD